MAAAESMPQSFTHALVSDVEQARLRLKENDTPTHRRELVRAVSAAVEGLHWELKQDVFRHAKSVTDLSIYERAALTEESYLVDEKGVVRPQPRFLPLPTAIRLVVNIVKRYRPTYEVDFSHPGWANLHAAVDVRNRLVHPKNIDDLTVTDAEIHQSLSAFGWLLALVIEVLRETNAHLKAMARQYAAIHDSSSNPAER